MKLTPVIFACALLISAPQLNAQDAPAPEWRFGLTSSADYCSYLLYINNERQETGSMFFREQATYGWSAGILGTKIQSQNMGFIAGLRFTEHNITTGEMDMYDVNRQYVGTIMLTYHTRYIDAPVGIQFNTHGGSRFQLMVNAVIAPGYAMGEWNEVDFEGSDTLGISDRTTFNIPDDFNHFSLKTELYAGVSYTNGPLQIQCLPQIRLCMLKATRDSYVNRRYWTTGVEFRVLYTI